MQGELHVEIKAKGYTPGMLKLSSTLPEATQKPGTKAGTSFFGLQKQRLRQYLHWGLLARRTER